MAGDDIVFVHSEERARMLSEGRKKKREKDRLIKMEEEKQEMLILVNKKEEEEEKVGNGEDGEEELEEEGKVKRTDRRGKVETKGKENKPRRAELPIIVNTDVQGIVKVVAEALRSLNSSQIKLHRVIYHLLEDIGKLIVEKAPRTFETQVAGEAQVLNIFEIKGRSKAKGEDVKIAGCRVIDGCVTRSSTMRLLRSGQVVFEGSCVSLKREKQDVDAIGKGNECGLVIRDCIDFRVGDIIQCLEQVNKRPKFISSESGAVRIEV